MNRNTIAAAAGRLLAAALFLAAAGHAPAQEAPEREVSGNWSFYAGYYSPEADGLGSGPTAGGRVAFDLGGHTGAEATVGYFRDDSTDALGQELRFTTIHGDASLTWTFGAENGRFSVMPLGGIGYARVRSTVAGMGVSQGSVTFHAGLAAKWNLGNDKTHLRVEVRGRQFERFDTLDWEATLGAGFLFRNK